MKTRKRGRKQKGGDPIFLIQNTITSAARAQAIQENRRTTRNKFIPPHSSDPPCHPSVIESALKSDTKSCMTDNQLQLLRKRWNEAHPEDAIPNNLHKTKLWHALKKAIKMCHTEKINGSEFCWIHQPFVPQKERTALSARFRPAAPGGWLERPTTWLDSNNIYENLKQLTEKYPRFDTIYPSPIDFDKRIHDKFTHRDACVVDDLCALNVKSDLLAKDKTALGVVFNLDPHDKPGSHWVALFVELAGSSPGAYYWDSYGYPAPRRIKVLMNRIQNQEIARGNTNFILRENEVRHQYRGSECGMYSLYFITSMLEGRAFDDICDNVVDDETINEMRHVYFAFGNQNSSNNTNNYPDNSNN